MQRQTIDPVEFGKIREYIDMLTWKTDGKEREGKQKKNILVVKVKKTRK